ncbi:MAG: helix-turn-helix domain-containing protein [Hyphomicrobium sp.]|nr:helix-turn-helix domain-containing protein [Hyphomicrobium sp.]
MKLRELSTLTGEPERQIRYMIAEGFVPPPSGGRATADYGEEHVAAIRRYASLRQQGFPPQAIRVLIHGGMSAPFPIAPGIALHVDPDAVGQRQDIEVLLDRISRALHTVFREPSDAARRKPPRKKPR